MGGPLTVSETGTTASFTVVLDAQPLTDVVISVSASDLSEATAWPATLTFTNGDWNVAQTVTVTGIDDAIADGNIASSVTLAVVDASSDNAFDPSPTRLSMSQPLMMTRRAIRLWAAR